MEEHTNKQAQVLCTREVVAITPKWQRLEGIFCSKHVEETVKWK
jgi:hypothetical protein